MKKTKKSLEDMASSKPKWIPPDLEMCTLKQLGELIIDAHDKFIKKLTKKN